MKSTGGTKQQQQQQKIRCFRSRDSFELLSGKHALLHHDGVVTWLCDVKLRSLCPVDLSDFPFDAQTCLLKLESGTSLDESIHMHISESPPDSLVGAAKGHVDTSMVGEWMLLGDEVWRASSASSLGLVMWGFFFLILPHLVYSTIHSAFYHPVSHLFVIVVVAVVFVVSVIIVVIIIIIIIAVWCGVVTDCRVVWCGD